MKKITLAILALFFLAKIANAQCNAAFSIAVDSFRTNNYTFISNSTSNGAYIDSNVWAIDGVPFPNQWYYGQSNYYTNLPSGQHQICLSIKTTAGCTSSTCQNINVPALTVKHCGWDTGFTAIASASDPHIISFTPLANQPNLSYHWDFGGYYLDSSNFSFSRAPTYTYGYPTTYSVKLLISDSVTHCFQVDSQAVVVAPRPSESCTASFTDTLNSQGQASFTAFSNQTITSQSWDIYSPSGNTIVLDTLNPVYNFKDTGNYSVILNITTSTGCVGYSYGTINIPTIANTSDTIRTDTTHTYTDTAQSITMQTQCNAGFTYTIKNNGIINFTAEEASPTIITRWYSYDNMGNKTYLGNSFEMVLTFAPGAYTITHIVSDSLNGCFDSVAQVMNVRYVALSNATESIIRDSSNALPNHYLFTAVTTYSGNPTLTGYWKVDGVLQPFMGGGGTQQDSFGNFITTYQYADSLSAGQHNICFITHTQTDSTITICQTVTVDTILTPPVQPIQKCGWNSSFTATPSVSDPHTISFTPSPNRLSLSYNWNFGDYYRSDSSNLVAASQPTYTYNNSGAYQVMLTITDTINHCFAVDTQTVVVSPRPSESCTGSFTYTTNQQGQISFTALSNQTIVSQVWTIYDVLNPGDTTTAINLTTSNPVYNFQDTGFHSVGVSITTNTGCIVTYWNGVYINSISNSNDSSRILTFPNPATGSTVSFSLTLNSAALIQYKVSDSYGNIVYQTQAQGIQGNNTLTIPVQTFNNGQYFIAINYGNQQKQASFLKL